MIGVAAALPVVPYAPRKNATTICDKVLKVVDRCTCVDRPAHVADIDCDMHFFGDRIGFRIDIEPCAPTPHLDVMITERRYNISVPIGNVRYGSPERIAIPGLNIGVPFVGNVGADAVIALEGTVNATTLSIGIDACAKVFHHYHCGSKLWHELPVWLMHDKHFDFGEVCSQPGAQLAGAEDA